MFKKISSWWNREDRITAMERSLREIVEAKQEAEQQVMEQARELKVLRDKALADEERRNGTDPWVEVSSANFSSDRGIQIELDWNDAFIAYLRENGVKGKTDEVVVQKWLAVLYEDLISRIDEESVEEIDPNKTSEYQ